MPEQTHRQLTDLGVAVDTTPYSMSFEDTVVYLSNKMRSYDLIVACQAVPDVYPALEMIEPAKRPPLIEHGGLVSEATAGPKHLTARYVGVCRQIRDAAASVMPDRPQHAVELPSMVDLVEFDLSQRTVVREAVRAELGISMEAPLVGWVGRLDRKKRVEDFIQAAARVRTSHPSARFVVIGGPDAFMPEYEQELAELSEQLGLKSSLIFLGDRSDVARLLSGLDVFVWLSRGEGMPHVISEAGAACLPVVATRDNGTEEQLEDGSTGIFVPHQSPEEVARAISSLIDDPNLRHRLGTALRRKVEQEYSAQVLIEDWVALFDHVIEEAKPRRNIFVKSSSI